MLVILKAKHQINMFVWKGMSLFPLKHTSNVFSSSFPTFAFYSFTWSWKYSSTSADLSSSYSCQQKNKKHKTWLFSGDCWTSSVLWCFILVTTTMSNIVLQNTEQNFLKSNLFLKLSKMYTSKSRCIYFEYLESRKLNLKKCDRTSGLIP